MTSFQALAKSSCGNLYEPEDRQKVPSKSYLSLKCMRTLKCIYKTCFYNSNQSMFIFPMKMATEAHNYIRSSVLTTCFINKITGQMGHRTFCSFQLYPKTLLSLSSTCMHMPTSVTLGIFHCVFSLLLCCGAGCCCVHQQCSLQGGN